MCHSMGGIVAADVLLGIIDEPTVSGSGTRVMFPYIQGILAFDTPYLGLAPGMFAHTVDAKVKTANAMLNQAASLAAGLFADSTKPSDSASDGKQVTASRVSSQEPKAVEENVRRSKRSGSKSGSHSRSSSRSTNTSGSKHAGKARDESKPRKSSLPPPTAPATTMATTASTTTTTNTTSTTTTAASTWQRWGKFAMAVGAFAAAGTVGYYKREEIAAGFSWASSHIEFVSELTKVETLKTRLSRSTGIRGVGFANLYTSLGSRKASSTVNGGNMGPPPGTDATLASFLAAERTFCQEPVKETQKQGWYKIVNIKANDEVEAHIGMFSPQTNPGFYEMSNRARDLVVQWTEA